jgi:hypothetical protein
MARLLLNAICWRDGDVGLIARGAVDDRTVASFEAEIARAISTAPVNLLIDVSECELASAGLAALLHLRSGRVTTVVVVASPVMFGILRMAGIASRYRIYSTLESARDACHDADVLDSITFCGQVAAAGTVHAFTPSVGAVLAEDRVRLGMRGARSGQA